MTAWRTERDALGEVRVPADALYGAQTQRAVENFPLSGLRLPRAFIWALGNIKAAAAEVNRDLGRLPADFAAAIVQAAEEVASGQWDDHFPVDVFQTGSGTSTNMNANEVIANRATVLLGGAPGEYRVHPNDHVNLGQSSNDVIPSALHLSAYHLSATVLLPGLQRLETALRRKAAAVGEVVKTGRTHLMDAMPITVGQELGGWAHQISEGTRRLQAAQTRLAELALGGTAVGTGVNAPPEFGKRVAQRLTERTGYPLRETDNHFAAQSSLDAATAFSGELRALATALLKIANDLRWMNSGPLAGLGEIRLPALQPGSSIMPGKVNPVIPEAVMMACVQVQGHDLTLALANQHGNFQLNVMLPVAAHNLLSAIRLLGRAAAVLAEKTVEGFQLNAKRIAEPLARNPILVTALAPRIGYDKASAIAKRAYAEQRPILEVAAEMTDIPLDELRRLLDPRGLTE